MKKTILTALLILVSMTALTACSGGSSKKISVDTAKLAEELNSGCVTSDSLTAVSGEMLPTIYFVDAGNIASASAYMSSGATACEVCVIQCNEDKQTEDVKKQFETRVESQSNLYASYNAGEVEKLKKALIKTAGPYAVLCVCDDSSKAEEILSGYGF